MSALLRLPPSQRDFEIFFAVAFQSVSTRRAAELHHISQTRVRQLVTLVGDWVADNLPDWGEADLKKQVRLAQHVAANRLEHQYEEAMLRWDAEGDPKHLRQATRIALAQARLGVVAGRIHALAAEITAGPTELGDDQSSRHTPCAVAPAPTRSVSEGHADVGWDKAAAAAGPPGATSSPIEDCSPPAHQYSRPDLTEGTDPALTDSPETLIEHERQQRLSDLEGAALIERRLLTLIENQGDANPDKVAALNATLARVRQEKATAELRLSRFLPGIQIEPLNLQSSPPPTSLPSPLTTDPRPLTSDL
jgi:hypothetical protein